MTTHRLNNPLPVASSDIVAIGTVISASPHLNQSGTKVYTTFLFTPDTLLKPKNKASVSPLLLERLGGVILYPSKERRFVGVTGMGLPEPTYKYILFLKSVGTGGSYVILAGYALVEGHVVSLDRVGKELESLSPTALISRATSLVSNP